MNTFVIIPALNEGGKIGDVVSQVREHIARVVVIDDGSSDNTGESAAHAGAELITHLINRGQGAALKTGIRYALEQGADIIVTFDADGQHAVTDILKLIEPIQGGMVEVTLGSRFLGQPAKNIPTLRAFVLRLAVIFTRVASGLKVTDTHNGLRGFSRGAAKKITIRQDRMAHASEILDEIARHKLPYQEVPVSIEYTDYSKGKGQSSLAFGKILVKYILGKLLR